MTIILFPVVHGGLWNLVHQIKRSFESKLGPSVMLWVIISKCIKTKDWSKSKRTVPCYINYKRDFYAAYPKDVPVGM